MACSRMLTSLLVLLAVAACEDKASTPSAQRTQDLTQAHANFGIQQLQERLRVNPEDFDALSRLGDLYFESGQYLSAIQSYDRALAVEPGCADCLNDKGLAQYYMGDTEGALASLDLANTVNPGYPNAWLSKGYILFSAGRHEEAIEPLRRVAATDASGVLAAEANSFLALIAEKDARE